MCKNGKCNQGVKQKTLRKTIEIGIVKSSSASVQSWYYSKRMIGDDWTILISTHQTCLVLIFANRKIVYLNLINLEPEAVSRSSKSDKQIQQAAAAIQPSCDFQPHVYLPAGDLPPHQPCCNPAVDQHNMLSYGAGYV